MRQGRWYGWLERLKAPGLGGGDPQPPQQIPERDRLVAALAHEREKVDKLKRRLERAEAEHDALASEARALYSALTLERHPPKIGTAAAPSWVDTAARARLRAGARGSDIDHSPAEAAPSGGRFCAPPPDLRSAIGPAATSWRPLRVAITNSATSAFRPCADPRVVARPLGDPLVEDADVLVFPRAESMIYLDDARLVSDTLWRRVAEGKTRIVLDASGEGHPHAPDASVDHHRFLQARGVDPGETLYLTQDRQYREDYEAWCRAGSVRPMRVWVFDAFVNRVLSEFQVPGRQVFNHRLARFLERPARRSRRFLSLNYTPRPTKVLFLLRLLRDGLWDEGWISFGGFSSDGQGEGLTAVANVKRLLAMEGFRDDLEELLPFMERLEAAEPIVFMAEKFKLHGKQRPRSVLSTDFDQYDDCWFTVVTETEMSTRFHRITEKPLKPLLGFHPFLILGSRGSLALLRGYGFETFGEVLDERYDEEPDPRRRFDMVYDQVRRLCAMDEAELARRMTALSEVVAFNACWGLTELPRRFRQTLVSGLVDQLAPGDTAA